MKRQTSLTFRNKAAANRYAAAYRKQWDLGLDGKPRQRTKEAKRVKDTGHVVDALRRLAKIWPEELVLVHLIDSAVLTLYTKHPQEGGTPIESFRIRADSMTELPNGGARPLKK